MFEGCSGARQRLGLRSSRETARLLRCSGFRGDGGTPLSEPTEPTETDRYTLNLKSTICRRRSMRPAVLSLALVLAASGCSKPPEQAAPPSAVALPPRLDSYFEQYCDYTGGLGIGFVAWHTYDYRFRQQLKETHDPELKRLYVLKHLHQSIEFALSYFEKGIVQTGKTSSRPLTFLEWQDTQKSIQAQIDDLATYNAFTNFVTTRGDPLDPPDPKLDAMWIEELRGKLRSITNAPAAN